MIDAPLASSVASPVPSPSIIPKSAPVNEVIPQRKRQQIICPDPLPANWDPVDGCEQSAPSPFIGSREAQSEKRDAKGWVCPDPLPANWDFKNGCKDVDYDTVPVPLSPYTGSRKVKRNETSTIPKANPGLNEGLVGSDDGTRPPGHSIPPIKREAAYNNFYNTPFELPKDTPAVSDANPPANKARRADTANEVAGTISVDQSKDVPANKTKRKADYNNFYNTPFELPKVTPSPTPSPSPSVEASPQTASQADPTTYTTSNENSYHGPPPISPFTGDLGKRNTEQTPDLTDDAQMVTGAHVLPKSNENPLGKRNATSGNELAPPGVNPEQVPPFNDHEQSASGIPPISGSTGGKMRREVNNWNTPMGPLKGEDQVQDGSHPVDSGLAPATPPRRRSRMVRKDDIEKYPTGTLHPLPFPARSMRAGKSHHPSAISYQ